MQEISHVYIDGRFVEPHGTELFDLHNPATGEVFGHVRLGDVEDTRAAIAAAKRALPSWSRSSKPLEVAADRLADDIRVVIVALHLHLRLIRRNAVDPGLE
jgi:acyl-CoA reductase-like NAD-dependent aldehyde dehydrogenase